MKIIDQVRLTNSGSELLGFICERDNGFMACTWSGLLAWFGSFDEARAWLAVQ